MVYNKSQAEKVAAENAAKQAAYNEVRAEAEHRLKIAPEMKRIVSSQGKQVVLDAMKNNKPAGLGYTQMVAYYAIAQLKAEKIIPMDRWGAGRYGHAAWVKANYPFDAYVPPVIQPSTPPVVAQNNPNPGADTAAQAAKIAAAKLAADNAAKVAAEKAAKLKADNAALTENAAKQAAYNEVRAEAEHRLKIAPEMKRIVSSQGKQVVLDAMKNNNPAALGYTQMVAYYAIAQLKAEKIIPMDRWGAGRYGHAAWVKANYVFDSYVPPVIQPSTPPVVAQNNPNPGADTAAQAAKVAAAKQAADNAAKVAAAKQAADNAAKVAAEKAAKLKADNAALTENAAKQAAYNEVRAEAEHRLKIAPEMQRIVASQGKQVVLDAMKNNNPAALGYTQMVAYYAIAQLKAEKIIPMDRWGAGRYGHAAWVKANYPFDAYVPPVVVAKPVVTPVVITPEVKAATPPVIETVNPKPADDPPVTGVILGPNGYYIPGHENDPNKKIGAKEDLKPGLFSNPLAKAGLLVIAFIVIIKILSK